MRRNKEDDKIYKEYIKTSAAGLEVGLSIVVGVLGGYYFDRYFETAPYGLIIGLVIGVAAAAKRLYKVTKKYLKENKDDDSSKKPNE